MLMSLAIKITITTISQVSKFNGYCISDIEIKAITFHTDPEQEIGFSEFQDSEEI